MTISYKCRYSFVKQFSNSIRFVVLNRINKHSLLHSLCLNVLEFENNLKWTAVLDRENILNTFSTYDRHALV